MRAVHHGKLTATVSCVLSTLPHDDRWQPACRHSRVNAEHVLEQRTIELPSCKRHLRRTLSRIAERPTPICRNCDSEWEFSAFLRHLCVQTQTLELPDGIGDTPGAVLTRYLSLVPCRSLLGGFAR